MRSSYHRVPGYRQDNAGLLSFSEDRLPILDESSINDGQHLSCGLLYFLQKRGFMGRCVVFKEHYARFFDSLHPFKRDSLGAKTEADEGELPQDSPGNCRPWPISIHVVRRSRSRNPRVRPLYCHETRLLALRPSILTAERINVVGE